VGRGWSWLVCGLAKHEVPTCSGSDVVVSGLRGGRGFGCWRLVKRLRCFT
jgi:hypothetical protein